MDIVRRYEDKAAMSTCSIWRLAVIARTSTKLVAKAITYHQSGLIVRDLIWGHQQNRAGTIYGWEAIHDVMKWDLYI